MKKSGNFAIIVYFIIFLVIGINIYDDYGVPWDEGVQNKAALINVVYINEVTGYKIFSKEKIDRIVNNTNNAEKIVPLEKSKDRNYGVINELILLSPTFILKNYNDTRLVILTRHFMTFLIFWVSCIYFYLIIHSLYKNRIAALFGVTALILSPRIFAEAFYNSKDLILLSFVIIAVYYSIRFLDNKKVRWAVLAGITSALAVDVRIVAMILPLATILIFIYQMIVTGKDNLISSGIKLLSTYVIVTMIFIYIFWPYLWETPFERFIESWLVMSKFGFTPNLLYMGEIINAGNIPWHYPVVWIMITTPALFIILMIAGILKFLYCLKDKNIYKKADISFSSNFLFFILSIGSIVSVIIFNSTLYNGWRQLFYIYPFLILLAFHFAYGLYRYLKKNPVFKNIYIIILLLNFAIIIYDIYSIHPLQMLYFNKLANNHIEKNFEKDYWGLSYRSGLEWLVENVNKPVSIYNEPMNPVQSSTRILKPEQKQKINFQFDFSKSKYLITNEVLFLFNSDNMLNYYNLDTNQLIYSKYVNDLKILSIYKLNNKNRIMINPKFKFVVDTLSNLNNE